MQKGDVVVLKSGGPKMTIRWIENNEAACDWFVKDEEKSAVFPLSSLQTPQAPAIGAIAT